MKSRSRAALIAVALSFATPIASADEPARDETLAPLRERFREGLEKYRAGAFAEAIVIWQKIYRDLGPEKGYRLAFDIARAYEQYGDATRAAESYEAYVRETARRRAAGESLEAGVEKQEADAEARLTELRKTEGRIHIAGDRSVFVRIDDGEERVVPRNGLTVYVAPGKRHLVTFDPGSKDEQRVEVPVSLGELVELTPPKPKEALLTPLPPLRTDTRGEDPFSPAVLWTAAGITAVSVALPIALYAHAGSIRDEYDQEVTHARASNAAHDDGAYRTAQANGTRISHEYESAQSTAHASLAVPIALGVVTAGLAIYFTVAKRDRRVETAFRF